MRQILLISLLMLPIHGVMAQGYDYAQQTYPAPASYPPQQASGNVYAGEPVYAPQPQPRYQAPANTAQQAPANQPRSSDYGQSVMTDIRQMNF